MLRFHYMYIHNEENYFLLGTDKKIYKYVWHFVNKWYENVLKENKNFFFKNQTTKRQNADHVTFVDNIRVILKLIVQCIKHYRRQVVWIVSIICGYSLWPPYNNDRAETFFAIEYWLPCSRITGFFWRKKTQGYFSLC